VPGRGSSAEGVTSQHRTKVIRLQVISPRGSYVAALGGQGFTLDISQPTGEEDSVLDPWDMTDALNWDCGARSAPREVPNVDSSDAVFGSIGILDVHSGRTGAVFAFGRIAETDFIEHGHIRPIQNGTGRATLLTPTDLIPPIISTDIGTKASQPSSRLHSD